MLRKNDEFPLKIDGMTTEGSGVGHKDGLAVFVANTAVGDVVHCHIIKAKKNYAVGKAMDLLTPSPDRIESDCTVSGRCGGCCYRHVSYEAELRYKWQRVSDAFSRIGHLDVTPEPVVGSKEQLAYRNKAQYPVGYDKELNIGFYAANSHRIVPCTDCKLQPALFTQVLQLIRNWILKNNISVYNEESHNGLLRHIYLRQGHFSKELMVCLVVNGTNVPCTFELLEELKEVPGFTTFVINYNTAKTNVILGPQNEVLFGEGFIRDQLLGCTFRISPLSFYQVNSAQCETLYRLAADYAQLTKEDVLLDLYCGTGTIGLTMADRAKQVYGVEIVEQAIVDARHNAEENGITNATFFCGDAAMAADKLRHDGVHADVILVDPPRKGLTTGLIQTIADMDPKRVVYVSCDPATLARDCVSFVEQDYEIQKVTPVDMFPRTAHVETVVLMSKKTKAKQ